MRTEKNVLVLTITVNELSRTDSLKWKKVLFVQHMSSGRRSLACVARLHITSLLHLLVKSTVKSKKLIFVFKYHFSAP